ncbi:MAG: hypothetical protein FJ267_01815, partial [Planctomycetes bacterium]|nr:hypothetical protein [Planctomycetota bacterium]
RDTRATDPGLANIANLTSITKLDLSEGIFGDEGMKHLAALKNLEDLNLWKVPVSNEGLTSIVGLTKLKKLNLSESRINDDGVKMLKVLTELEDLNLSQTEITPSALEQITELKKLKKLTINFCTMITTESKEALQKGMPELKVFGP